MKKIWIIAPFTDIDTVGVRNRFKYLANRLHTENMNVTLFTSMFNHMTKKHIDVEKMVNHSYKVQLINEPGYMKNVSIKRALSHAIFSINFKKKIYTMEKPDLIYTAYPTMTAAYVAGKYAERYNIPFIIDVQDTWPESISTAIDINQVSVRFLMWPFTQYANMIYKMADVVFGVSETYVQRANVKGTHCKNFIPVYIGVEMEKFADCYIEDNVCKNNNDIWITYVGALSFSYDIDTAIKAIAELNEHKNIKLNILGGGQDEKRLIELAKALNVYNTSVRFHGYVKYEAMVSILKNSDIALNALTIGSKGTITNKFGDYVSAGLPLLNSCQQKEVLDLVNNKNLGINYSPGSIDSLKNSIIKMINDRKQMKIFSMNSLTLAEEYFDRQKSYEIIIEKIKEQIAIHNIKN